jgi:hypothetical protein
MSLIDKLSEILENTFSTAEDEEKIYKRMLITIKKWELFIQSEYTKKLENNGKK